MSQALLALMSPQLVNQCRLLDRVVITGQREAMEIHTLDLNLRPLSVAPGVDKKGAVWNALRRFKARQVLEREKAEALNGSTEVAMSKLEDLPLMREAYTEEFQQLFIMGYQNYIMGEWKNAERYFSQTKTLLDFTDGPSQALLEFMGRYQFQAPPAWPGHHPIEFVERTS